MLVEIKSEVLSAQLQARQIELQRSYDSARSAWLAVCGCIAPRDPDLEEVDTYNKRIMASLNEEQKAAYIAMERIAAELISGPGGP